MIIVPDPKEPRQRRRALGHIKYEKKAGRVILVNSCAQIQPEVLQLGHTSKQGNAKLAGCHGEGLKLAALVMSRNGYKAKIATVQAPAIFVQRFRRSGSIGRCGLLRPYH
jgi:hypothetical protein